MSKNYGGVGGGSRRGQAQLSIQRTSNFKGTSPRPSLKTSAEHASVTLDDVKSVALDSMPDMVVLPPAFQGCYRCVYSILPLHSKGVGGSVGCSPTCKLMTGIVLENCRSLKDNKSI